MLSSFDGLVHLGFQRAGQMVTLGHLERRAGAGAERGLNDFTEPGHAGAHGTGKRAEAAKAHGSVLCSCGLGTDQRERVQQVGDLLGIMVGERG